MAIGQEQHATPRSAPLPNPLPGVPGRGSKGSAVNVQHQAVPDPPQQTQAAGSSGGWMAPFAALLRSRGGWALADQGVVSAGNFITGVLLVRNLEKVEYGVYFLIFGVLQFLHSLHQSLVTYPLSVRGAVSDQDDLRKL